MWIYTILRNVILPQPVWVYEDSTHVVPANRKQHVVPTRSRVPQEGPEAPGSFEIAPACNIAIVCRGWGVM